MVKIMIADDNKESAQQLCYLLTKEENFEVINISTDGMEALQSYKKLNPDVLLLDLDMPKLNGLELLNIIPRYDSKRNVIIVSGSLVYRSNISNIDKVKTIIQKPYNINTIIKYIKEISPQETISDIEKRIHTILENLQFNFSAKGTILLESAIFEAYKTQQLKLDDIMESVKKIHNEKNAKTVHSLIDKQLESMYDDKNNLDIFIKFFPDYYGFKPTTKNFIKFILRKIQ